VWSLRYGGVGTMTYAALAIAAVFVVIDRITKSMVTSKMSLYETVQVIPNVVDFHYIQNQGAAFSILEGHRAVLILIPSVFIVLALFWLLSKKIRDNMMIWGVSLAISGGFGNLIDRIMTGYVTDFIELKFVNFAIFNIADICAVIGACLLAFAMVREEIASKKHVPEQDKSNVK
jgi:signal peptidase II